MPHIFKKIIFQTCSHANFFLLYIQITEQQKKIKKNVSKRYLRGSEVCLPGTLTLKICHFLKGPKSLIFCVHVVQHDETSKEM